MTTTGGTPVINIPPTVFPSFWTQAQITQYLDNFARNNEANIPNYAPWWLNNPQWAEPETTFTPLDDSNRDVGNSAGYISSQGIFVPTPELSNRQQQQPLDPMLILMLFMMNQ